MNKKPFGSKEKRGFALVLTLALISFVFMLVMSMVTQVRSELSFSDARQNLILAKAHARMGMMIAIGEIQKHLGPDMRVSTTADIYDERIELSSIYENTNYPQSQTTTTFVDLDEDGSSNDHIPLGQRMWTGVWKTRGGNSEKSEEAYRPLPNNGDAGVGFPKSWDTDDSWDRHPAVELAWLISGNEGWVKKLGIYDSTNMVQDFIEVPDGVIIDDDGRRVLNDSDSKIYGKAENAWADHKIVVDQELVDYFHPLQDISESLEEFTEWTYILRAPVLNSNGEFAAEPVKVPKTKIVTDRGITVGNYAYWVGDEGVKAKFNLEVPPDLSDASHLAVAASPNFSVSGAFDKGSGSTDLISFASILEDEDDSLVPYYHQFTVDSYGVLSDVRTGGLKRDLSLAFAKDSSSDLWEKDFNDNFIFRDRVHCLKSLPIYAHQSQKAFGKGLHRNHWFDQAEGSPRGPLVNDKNALLAGPRWSVLAEYHKLYEKYQEAREGRENEHFKKLDDEVTLKVAAPDEFPRVVGDNALIFDRRGIEGSQGMKITEARPFFNIFGGPKRVHRPEPKNHPIFPILTKVGVSVFPAVGTEKLSLAISPKLSLWNPYDRPMSLENLILEVPFRNGSFDVSHFNLKEYDLYRKWWIRLYNNVDEFPTKDTGSKNTKDTRAKLKKPNTPWGLFKKVVDFERISAGDEAAAYVVYNEPGILDAKKKTFSVLGSTQGLQLTSLSNGTRVIAHENIRENVTYDGDFHFFSFANDLNIKVNLPKVYLRVEDTILEPGEIANFSIENLQSQDIPKNPQESPPIISVRKGDLEDFFLWESSFAYTSQQLLSDYLVSYILDFTGVKGFGSNTLEQINKTPNGFNYSQLGTGFSNYESLALYQNEDGNFDNFNPDKAKMLVRFTQNYGATEILAQNALKDYVNISTTERYLRDNYQNAFDRTDEKLPGIGWEWRVSLPADDSNERVILNDFNIRALVHSSQEGSGYWMNRWVDHKPDFMYGEMLKRGFSFEGVETYSRTDEDGNILTFDLSDEYVVPLYANSPNFNYPTHMKNPPISKEFPWLYEFAPGWDPNSYTILNERALNNFPSNLSTYDPDTRASQIGLIPTGENPGEIVEAENDNIMLLESIIPRAINSEEKIGFFSSSSSRQGKIDRKEIGSELKSSSRAVLFEIPQLAPLSILQYRHANLNNYLHSPSYALGNSYATTQVARHRPWGRMDAREQRIVKNDPSVPEAETWTASIMVPADMVQLEDEYNAAMDAKYGQAGFLLHKRLVESWHTSAVDLTDKDSRFAPWRGQGANINNHQNTTLDLSFYLNRALLDGYFLTGSTDPDDFNNENNSSLGDRFRPFYFEPEGNHRLHAYMRKTGTWEDARSSFGSLSLEKDNSTTDDDEYRYQSIAGDLLVEGSFNINSTSVDAWVAQLASLRGKKVPNATVNAQETPVVRFFSEPAVTNDWNELRKLSDEEIIELAKQMVRQVKLRGPFLSFSDFVNRRLNPSPMDPDPSVTKGSRPILLQKKMSEWSRYPENRNSVLGLRGAVQAAIATAGLNDDEAKGWVTNNSIPQWPSQRWVSQAYKYSKFGYHAVSIEGTLFAWWDNNRREWKNEPQKFGSGMTYNGEEVVQVLDSPSYGTAKLFNSTISYKSTSFGEAPENLLAVENVATGANKPGWVMQADLLSPLVPVTSARSDTFTVRVMGETTNNPPAKSWIELVVQRTPDYVKADIDAPHHRPHEPFKDLNFNGYWDNDGNLVEQWVDLNRNGDVVKNPDLPGVGESGRESDYRDGMESDLKLNLDPQEEDTTSPRISTRGVNQRFGRKFKIVRFRWLREQDV